ncbi:MAG: heme-dependent oxidative N-demethylase subunit alpha family protein, partial [Bdellovibrionia bacterium]
MTLSPCPFYFPIDKGIYEVAPGLRPLKWDFGNGNIDSKVFQIARDYEGQRQNKIECRQERLSKYVCEKNLDPVVKNKVASFIAQKLVTDNPDIFNLESSKEKISLKNLITNEILWFDHDYNLVKFESLISQELSPKDNLDALALFFSEDIAITSRQGDHDWLSYLNLCSPSHWAAEDKIGLSFAAVHVPIPGIERILKNSSAMVEA